MTGTILLADDSKTIQRAIQIAFAGEPYKIVCVSDGESAIKKAQEIGPVVVLADHKMPGRSGYDVAEALHRDPATSHIPVLILAGSATPYDEARANAAGARGHVPKPFDCATIVNKVIQAMKEPAASSSGKPTATGFPPPPPAAAGFPPPPPAAAGFPPPPPAVAGFPPPPPAAAGFPPPAPAAARFPPAPPAAAGFPPPPPAAAGFPPPPPAAAGFPPPPPAAAGFPPPPPAAAGFPPPPPAAAKATFAPAPFAGSAPPTTPRPPVTSSPFASIAKDVEPVVAARVVEATKLMGASVDGDVPSKDQISAATREIIERVVWEVVPELAEALIKEEIRRLMSDR